MDFLSIKLATGLQYRFIHHPIWHAMVPGKLACCQQKKSAFCLCCNGNRPASMVFAVKEHVYGKASWFFVISTPLMAVLQKADCRLRILQRLWAISRFLSRYRPLRRLYRQALRLQYDLPHIAIHQALLSATPWPHAMCSLTVESLPDMKNAFATAKRVFDMQYELLCNHNK